MVTMSVHPHTLCCHIDKLDEELLKIEKSEGFYKWCSPPLEQLNGVLSLMTDPKSVTIPPVILYWISLTPDTEEENEHD